MEQLRSELAKAIAKHEAKLAAINSGASEEVIEKKETASSTSPPRRPMTACPSSSTKTPYTITCYRNGTRYGHCDYKSMKPYIDITESAKRDAISLMEKAFDAK